MPITKIPIVHKFGIISHTQRLELQERLLKQSYIQTLKSQKVLVPTRQVESHVALRKSCCIEKVVLH